MELSILKIFSMMDTLYWRALHHIAVAKHYFNVCLFVCLLKLVVTIFSTFVPFSLYVQFATDDECFLLTLIINKLELIVL